MNDFIFSNQGIWISIGLFLIIIELLTGTGFLIWLGISALVTGIVHCCFSGLLWQYGLFVFSVISILSVIFWWRKTHKNCS